MILDYSLLKDLAVIIIQKAAYIIGKNLPQLILNILYSYRFTLF